MATSDIDRLSDLPDELLVTILSFLPTRVAARTSILCRRFRHLCVVVWQTSPSLELISRDFRHRKTSTARFLTMVERTFLCRSLSHPLPSLHIEFSKYLNFCSLESESSFLSSLFDKARSLGVHHLTFEDSCFSPFGPTLPLIFSIDSLKSLSLPPVIVSRLDDSIFPPAVNLTNLKSLSIEKYYGDPDRLNRLLSQLCSLEDFSFELRNVTSFSLSNQTIRKLKLVVEFGGHEDIIELSLPSLKELHVQNYLFSGIPHFCGDMPSLEKAVLNSSSLRKDETYPFPFFLKPSKDLPNFPDLKHLNATMCFHRYNFKAIATLLHQCPALESIMLVHKVPLSNSLTCSRNENDWRSMLPCKADKVFYTNLHLGQHSEEFMKLKREGYMLSNITRTPHPRYMC
ncbi:hypothetical protein LUZ61_010936 [Rhynchospora tenuis]|uniref:F-box domain-containing protein n=1 Tax=Rhynchospora tenuis TaxID=198213 RepID=A0AAD6EZS8_9POAL|nr:hypothetical protein LUZ61_010936 [Rhynchospora tenuis]